MTENILDPGSDLVSAIYSELVKLREREGLTYQKLREVKHAKQLKTLPVVDREMNRSGTDDRALALLAVIKCAILREVRAPDFSAILLRTFNLDGCGDRTLSARESSLSKILRVTGNNLKDRIKAAYLELAAVLVAAEESPCFEGGVATGPEIEAQAFACLVANAPTSVTVEIPTEALIRQLLEIFVSPAGASRAEGVASAVVNRLPNIQPYASGFESMAEVLKFVLLSLAARLRPSSLDEIQGASGRSFNALNLEVIFSGNFQLIETDQFAATRPNNSEWYRLPRRKLRIGNSLIRLKKKAWVPYFERPEGIFVSKSYWESKASFLDELSATMMGFEGSNRWSEIFGEGEIATSGR
jgi:hypothetical protein